MVSTFWIQVIHIWYFIPILPLVFVISATYPVMLGSELSPKESSELYVGDCTYATEDIGANSF